VKLENSVSNDGKKVLDITKLILSHARSFPLLGIDVFGWMGTGKTNFITLLMQDFEKLGWEIRYIVGRSLSKKEFFEQAKEAFTLPVKKPYLFVALDDVSFMLPSAMNKNTREVLQAFSTSRHETGADHVIALFSVHDLTAISPFVRAAQIFVFTSMDKASRQRLWQYFRIGGPSITKFMHLRRLRKDVILYCDKMIGQCIIVKNVPLAREDPYKYVFSPVVQE